MKSDDDDNNNNVKHCSIKIAKFPPLTPFMLLTHDRYDHSLQKRGLMIPTQKILAPSKSTWALSPHATI